MKKNNTIPWTGIGCAVLFLGPFIIMAIGTLSVSSYNLIKAMETYSFVQVEATLENNELQIGERRNKPRARPSSKVKLNYYYSFDGKEYQGDRVAFGYSKNNVDRHGYVFEKLKYVTKLKVWVNPYFPNESVMTQGTNESTIALFIFALMVNSMTIIFVIPFFIGNKKYDMKNEIFASQNEREIKIAKLKKNN